VGFRAEKAKVFPFVIPPAAACRGSEAEDLQFLSLKLNCHPDRSVVEGPAVHTLLCNRSSAQEIEGSGWGDLNIAKPACMNQDSIQIPEVDRRQVDG
jgi:hypothetical protein